VWTKNRDFLNFKRQSHFWDFWAFLGIPMSEKIGAFFTFTFTLDLPGRTCLQSRFWHFQLPIGNGGLNPKTPAGRYQDIRNKYFIALFCL
jgi:hypothetical protein